MAFVSVFQNLSIRDSLVDRFYFFELFVSCLRTNKYKVGESVECQKVVIFTIVLWHLSILLYCIL